ncbi:MAG TPA: hypothetical protein VJR29_11550 [bacterium]|nr:hypothetical protein [bacterium]
MPWKIFLLLFVLAFASCSNNDECSEAALALGKFGSTGGCGCLNNNDCPAHQTCDENPFDFVSDCSCEPGSNGAECAVDSHCPDGQTCSFNCLCEGGPSPSPTPNGCAPVNVEPGTVPFGGACDADVDCADELPCVDCSCV